MKLLSILKHLVLGGLLPIAAAGTAFAQTAANFPDRLVRIVVPFGAGTTTDQAARFIAQRITEQTKQTVIVDNKAGANGFIGVQYMLSQPADGYTILIGTNTTHAANRALFKKLPYDPVADFIPLTGVIVGGVVLTVSPNMPVNNVPELIALLKKSPGKYTFGSGNSSSRGGGEVFKDLAGVDILHVPYKALPMAITDLMGGQIDMVFGDAPAVMPHVRAGKLKALGVSTRTRMPGYEDIPTVAEQGGPPLRSHRLARRLRAQGHTRRRSRQAQQDDRRHHAHARGREVLRRERLEADSRHGRRARCVPENRAREVAAPGEERRHPARVKLACPHR